MSRDARLLGLFLILSAGVVLFQPRTAEPHEMYDDPGDPGVGCVECHSLFKYIGNTPGPTHQDHTNGATFNCSLCHMDPLGDAPVFTYDSDRSLPEPSSRGCAGCHGREYGEEYPPGSGNTISSARGLRLVHERYVPPAKSCFACHLDDPAGPAPENVAPYYFARADVDPKDPCNADGSEDYFGNGTGLDNDGDGLYDQADPDCAALGSDLYRNDEITMIEPPTPALSSIFTGSGMTTLGAEDLYQPLFPAGDPDPDTTPVVDDPSRPLIFYQVELTSNTVMLEKAAGGTLLIWY